MVSSSLLTMVALVTLSMVSNGTASIHDVSNKCSNKGNSFCYGIKDGIGSYGPESGCIKSHNCDAYVVAEKVLQMESYEGSGIYAWPEGVPPMDTVPRYFERGPSKNTYYFYLFMANGFSMVDFFTHGQSYTGAIDNGIDSNGTTVAPPPVITNYTSARIELVPDATGVNGTFLSYPTVDGNAFIKCSASILPCYRVVDPPIRGEGYTMAKFFRITFEDKPQYAYLGLEKIGSKDFIYHHTKQPCSLFGIKVDGSKDVSKNNWCGEKGAGPKLPGGPITGVDSNKGDGGGGDNAGDKARSVAMVFLVPLVLVVVFGH